jgi:predicted DNA-binding transcriptional regulator YafY
MLMRDLHDIRDVIRLFLIYGFFSKKDIMMRNGMKAITYDKYKKTIQNLIDNTKIKSYTNEAREKCVYISVDYVQETDNPLFTIWQGKSLTSNDIWYLFAITDALAKHDEGLTVSELTARLAPYRAAGIEEQTVRNRLEEMRKLGLVQTDRSGKRKIYKLHPPFLENLDEDQLRELDTACSFFQNVYPIGVLGYHLRQKMSILLPEASAAFMFKHHHLGGTVDDEVLLQLFQAMREKRKITFHLQQSQGNAIRFIENSFVPMKLIADLWQGRRYIAGYHEDFGRCWSFRLDKMFHVQLREEYPFYEEKYAELERQLAKSWCVVMAARDAPLDEVVMTLAINPQTESYVLDRLHAEGKWGTVRQMDSERFEYRIEVNDAQEMIPWIRTFTGRIVDFRCSNPAVAAKLSEDWQEALNQYEREDQV